MFVLFHGELMFVSCRDSGGIMLGSCRDHGGGILGLGRELVGIPTLGCWYLENQLQADKIPRNILPRPCALRFTQGLPGANDHQIKSLRTLSGAREFQLAMCPQHG